MTLTSLSFFAFLIVTLILYYLVRPLQKYILLAASIFFYISISSLGPLKLAALMIGVFSVTYFGALLIDKTEGGVKRTILTIGIVLIVSVLFVLKYAYNILETFAALFNVGGDFSCLQFVAIIGISYYALSAIGYMIDVFWGTCKAEKNPANVALFIFYFPQLISGPFTRFNSMNVQFEEKHTPDYERITYGMRRMVFGYFKKLVISERFSMAVDKIFTNYEEVSAVGIAGATLCYAVELYTDFSGCMDIIMGASSIFGIELPENFKAPFFSETLKEFWQRWHITLGTWFKDYFMYPLQKSGPIQKLGKWAKKKLGKTAGRKVPFYSAMLVLWIAIGIWHGGTGYYFIASAAIPCVLLIISDLCQPLFGRINKALRINTDCASWHWFRRVRTLLLICICWFVVCSGENGSTLSIMAHMCRNVMNLPNFVITTNAIGLDTLDVLMMAIGVVVIFISQKCEYEETTILKKMDEQNIFFRILLIYAEIVLIMLCGMVGKSAFIYFQF